MDELLATIFNRKDAAGNKFELEGEDLFLTLVSDRRRRNIGRIIKNPTDGKIKYIKHEAKKDIFRANESWSIPYFIVKNVDYIQFFTEDTDYRITSEKVEDVGSFLWFKDSGFEQKIYVPLTEWWKGKL